MVYKPAARQPWRRDLPVDAAVLAAFEDALDPARPLEGPAPVHVLGVGPLSVVFEIPTLPGVALKRLPPFATPDVRTRYQRAIEGYRTLLADQLGVPVVEQRCIPLDNRHGEHVLYVAQVRQSPETIGSRVFERCSDEQAVAIVEAILETLLRVWFRNTVDEPQSQTGFDAQLANWAVFLREGAPVELRYLDTGTPAFRRIRQDLIDPEPFIRQVPSWMSGRVRAHLREVFTRYYDLRAVLVDLLAGLHADGHAARVPMLTRVVNRFVEVMADEFAIAPITEAEVRRYAADEAHAWGRFHRLSRFNRFVHTRLRGRRYPYLIPEKPEKAARRRKDA